jgi:endonuclease YncB( thermonuclease family)
MVHDFKTFPELTNSQMELYYFDSPHKQITEDFIAKVTKVHDGDTITLKCNFRDFEFPLRLARINAPELSEGGKESKSWLEEQLLNEEVNIIINPKNRVEKWGRLLGDVISKGMSMSDLSLTTGHAVTFGDLNFTQELNKMEKQWL